MATLVPASPNRLVSPMARSGNLGARIATQRLSSVLRVGYGSIVDYEVWPGTELVEDGGAVSRDQASARMWSAARWSVCTACPGTVSCSIALCERRSGEEPSYDAEGIHGRRSAAHLDRRRR